MTLAALIQKGGLARVATATSATSATKAHQGPATVATVATVAAASPARAHYRWRVTLPGGTPFEVCCLPEVTTAEMQELYRGATVLSLHDAPSSPCDSATVEERPAVTPDVA
jgi:hypothetical protein